MTDPSTELKPLLRDWARYCAELRGQVRTSSRRVTTLRRRLWAAGLLLILAAFAVGYLIATKS